MAAGFASASRGPGLDHSKARHFLPLLQMTCRCFLRQADFGTANHSDLA